MVNIFDPSDDKKPAAKNIHVQDWDRICFISLALPWLPKPLYLAVLTESRADGSISQIVFLSNDADALSLSMRFNLGFIPIENNSVEEVSQAN